MAPRPPSARHATPCVGLVGTGRAGTPRRCQDSWARDARARPAVVQDSPGPGLACRQRTAPQRAVIRRAMTGRASTGRHPPGHDGPLPNGPSSQRARHARRIRSGQRPSAARPPGVGKPPNGQLSAAPLAGVWSVEDRSKRQLLGNARAADR